MTRKILTVLAALAMLASVAPAASAAPPIRDVAYVEVTVTAPAATLTAILAAEQFVDGYTGSTMVLAPCRQLFRCIRVRMAPLPADVAHTVVAAAAPYDATITVNTHGALGDGVGSWIGPDLRLKILAHEFGHAHRLIDNGLCSSVMYPRMRCATGAAVPLTFTAAERAALATR